MDLYLIALFVHLLTLAAAAATHATMTIAIRRRARARTLGDVLDWHGVIASGGKAFPICLASFVLTGVYMMSLSQTRILSTGYAVAGLVGVACLLVSGIYLGTKGKALKGMLDEMAKKGLDQPAPRLVPPPLIAVLPSVNTSIALAVAFDMTIKPPSLPIALGVLVVAAAFGGIGALRRSAAADQQAQTA